MGFIPALIDVNALVAFLVITILSIILFKKVPSIKECLSAIGSFTLTLAMVLSMINIVHALYKLDSLEQLGPPLAFSILILLYTALLKIGLMVYLRFKYVPRAV